MRKKNKASSFLEKQKKSLHTGYSFGRKDEFQFARDSKSLSFNILT